MPFERFLRKAALCRQGPCPSSVCGLVSRPCRYTEERGRRGKLPKQVINRPPHSSVRAGEATNAGHNGPREALGVRPTQSPRLLPRPTRRKMVFCPLPGTDGGPPSST